MGSSRPLYIPDSHRIVIETAIGESIRSSAELAAIIQHRMSIKVGGVSIPIEGAMADRLDERSENRDTGEWVKEQVVQFLLELSGLE